MADLIRCLILGGGGHAKVLIDGLLASETALPMAVLDADSSLWKKKLLDVPIEGGDDLIPELMKQGATHFIVGLGGTGDNRPRRQLFEKGLTYGLTPLTVIHPSAVCSRWAAIGEGSVVYPSALINAGAVIGRNVIINTGAIVEHDCAIGDHAHIAPGAILSGMVMIGQAAHVGAGATVRQGISIGEGAVIGAGAVVVENVEAWKVVAGVPTRVIKNHVDDHDFAGTWPHGGVA